MNAQRAEIKSFLPESLCLTCGLCCNGVIFQDVELQPGDDAAFLQSLGLPLKNIDRHRGAKMLRTIPKSKIQNPKFPQPCAALEGCRCGIHPDRPTYCLQFECLLLKDLQAGKMDLNAAHRIVGSARRCADKVLNLLRKLGDADEHLNLRRRFLRTQRRLEAGTLNAKTAAILAELTIAMHRLNLLLRESFYPDVED